MRHTLIRSLRLPLLAMSLLLLALAPLQAAVPHDKAQPAYAEEQTILQLEQGLKEPGLADRASGIAHVDRHSLVQPGRTPEYNVILQRGGNTWRTWRNGPLAVLAGVLLLITLAAVATYHFTVGPTRSATDGPGTDRQIQRFTRGQRWVHWAAAISFVVLALSGLILLFGKELLLPWMGHELFSWLAIISKWGHNIAGPLFVLASLVMFFTYLRHNHFQRADLTWLLSLGGMFSKQHVPAPYFNAGEKLWFWLGVTFLGLWMAVTGLMLNFPYIGEVGTLTAFTRYQLQWANVLHLVGAAFYTAFSLGHIYLGTVGSPGAWRAMAHGSVSERWAQDHHQLWYDEELRRRARGTLADGGRP